VTFDEWDACIADGGCNGYQPEDGSPRYQHWGRGRRPVIFVNWDDAKAYVAWLSRKTGKPYRLLSEAEREFMTRAGTTTPFWWGSQIATNLANYNGEAYQHGPKGEDREMTMPVDSFFPNPWGLYQVHGNVNEWVEDCWNDTYEGAPSDGSAWTTADCHFRVVRGGSWLDAPRGLRSAFRQKGISVDVHVTATNGRFNELRQMGFRVGRTLTP
jgi:formylglycine-generating enzyme required for sulfatase activity